MWLVASAASETSSAADTDRCCCSLQDTLPLKTLLNAPIVAVSGSDYKGPMQGNQFRNLQHLLQTFVLLHLRKLQLQMRSCRWVMQSPELQLRPKKTPQFFIPTRITRDPPPRITFFFFSNWWTGGTKTFGEQCTSVGIVDASTIKSNAVSWVTKKKKNLIIAPTFSQFKDKNLTWFFFCLSLAGPVTDTSSHWKDFAWSQLVIRLPGRFLLFSFSMLIFT